MEEKVTFRSKLLKGVCLAFLIASSALSVFAQSEGSTAATITGRVADETERAVGGAHVTVKNLNTNLVRESISNEDGSIFIPQLSPGTYEITIEADGFTKATLRQEILLGTASLCNFVLKVSGKDITVEVVGENKANLNKTEDSINISRQSIESLPINRRDFLDFTLTSSRVVTDRLPAQGVAETSRLSFNAQSARFNNITIDGLSNNDITSGSVRATFSQEAVQEFQIISDTSSAEFGRSLGGIVNIVTRGGGNDYHGSLFLLNRNDKTSARDAFVSFKPPYSQYQFGAVVSGPIKKEKAFFFLGFERLTIRQNNIVTIKDDAIQAVRNIGIPANNGPVPFGIGKTTVLTRVDAQLTPNDTIYGRYNYGGVYDGQYEPFGDRTSETNGATERLRDNSIALNNVYINAGKRLVNETRFLYSRRKQSVIPIVEGPAFGLSTPDGISIFGQNFFTPQIRDERIYQFANITSLERGLNHIKLGIDYNYINAPTNDSLFSFTNSGAGLFSAIDFGALTGMPNLPVLSGIQALDPSSRTPTQRSFLMLLSNIAPVLVPGFPAKVPLADLSLPLIYAQGFGKIDPNAPVTLFSTFVQDDIKLKPNLLIKAGLRYDINRLKFSPDNNGNFSPRLGIAYRPTFTNKLNLRASYGLFFGTPLIGPAVLAGSSQSGNFVFPTFFFPQSILVFAQPNHRIDDINNLPKGVSIVPQEARTFQFDPNTRNSYTQQLSAGFDYLLERKTVVGVSYNYVRGIKLVTARRINPVVRPTGNVITSMITGRVDTTKGDVTEFESAFDSYYHGLTINLVRNFSENFGIFASYTLSKSIDNTFDVRTDTADSPVNPLRPGDERALSIQDVRNRFVLSANLKLNYTKNLLLRDFQIATITTIESGRPYNLTAGVDLNQDGDNGTGDRPAGIGRNTGITPGFSSVDMRLSRSFKFKERYQILGFVEVFNLFNKFNLSKFNTVFPPDAQGNFNLPSQEGGRFTVPKDRYQGAFAPRQMQIGFKISF